MATLRLQGEGGYHPRKQTSNPRHPSVDFYHSPVAVWVNSAPQPKKIMSCCSYPTIKVNKQSIPFELSHMAIIMSWRVGRFRPCRIWSTRNYNVMLHLFVMTQPQIFSVTSHVFAYFCVMISSIKFIFSQMKIINVLALSVYMFSMGI